MKVNISQQIKIQTNMSAITRKTTLTPCKTTITPFCRIEMNERIFWLKTEYDE